MPLVADVEYTVDATPADGVSWHTFSLASSATGSALDVTPVLMPHDSPEGRSFRCDAGFQDTCGQDVVIAWSERTRNAQQYQLYTGQRDGTLYYVGASADVANVAGLVRPTVDYTSALDAHGETCAQLCKPPTDRLMQRHPGRATMAA